MHADQITVARAPLRISLAGGGTDLPSYAGVHGGKVIGLAIDRYVSATVFPRSFGGGIQVRTEDIEAADDVDGLGDRFVSALLSRSGVRRDVQVASAADAPTGTGLGGSGAFSVAALSALNLDRDPSPRWLAETASEVEMVVLQRPVGQQDHFMAAYGGLRMLDIDRDMAVSVTSDVSVTDEFRDHVRDRLMLFYTHTTRDAARILEEQAETTRNGDATVVAALHAIRRLADEAHDALRQGRYHDIGPILAEHWRCKVRLGGGITSAAIDRVYAAALAAGSDGGKVLGAGGGGFLLLSAPSSATGDVRSAMAEAGLTELEFGLDESGIGATTLPLADPVTAVSQPLDRSR